MRSALVPKRSTNTALNHNTAMMVTTRRPSCSARHGSRSSRLKLLGLYSNYLLLCKQDISPQCSFSGHLPLSNTTTANAPSPCRPTIMGHTGRMAHNGHKADKERPTADIGKNEQLNECSLFHNMILS